MAGVYNELHVWGGSVHGTLVATVAGDSVYEQRYKSIVDANIDDCLTYDLRRTWIQEELAD